MSGGFFFSLKKKKTGYRGLLTPQYSWGGESGGHGGGGVKLLRLCAWREMESLGLFFCECDVHF